MNASSTLLSAVIGLKKDPRKIQTLYYGSPDSMMRLTPEKIDGTDDRKLWAYTGIETAKLLAFVEVIRKKYGVITWDRDGNRIHIGLSSASGPSVTAMNAIKKSKIHVYHLSYQEETWEPYGTETFCTEKILSAEIERQETISVADWLRDKSVSFSKI